MDKNDVTVEKLETAFQGYFRIDRYHVSHRTFDGGRTPVFTRELFERGHAVVVLPYDPVSDRVVLIEQFRIGALAAGWENPWLLEVVAGIVDPGETPEQVALREMQEEAGAQVRDMVYITRYLASPGGTSESVWLYCARVDADSIGGNHGLAHEHEDIRALTVPAEKAFAMVANGRINNAAAIIALQWLQLHRQELRTRWL